MSEDFPYSAEYAKSGRSSCRTCGSAIPKDHIRIAKLVQSPHFDGKMALWNHFNCFFRKNTVKSTGDIKGFGTLRYEDQTKIKDKVGGLISVGKDVEVAADVVVEYAKSNRSTCKGCFISIDKGTVRIGAWVDAEGSEMKWAVNGKKQAWHHPPCFVDRRTELDIDLDITADMLNGYKNLDKDDQIELVKLLGKGGKNKMRKKLKENSAAAANTKTDKVFEKKLMQQSKYLTDIRRALKQLSNNTIRLMLEANEYPTHGGDIKLIERCADGVAFGRISHICTACNSSYFKLGENNYVCTGDVSEFTKCRQSVEKPTRVPWMVPDAVKEISPFFEKLKLKTGNRLFNTAEPRSTGQSSVNSKHVLKDYVFCTCVESVPLDGEERDVKPAIEAAGGKVCKKFSPKCNAIITDSVDLTTRTVKRAVSLEVPIVDANLLLKGLKESTIKDLSEVCFSGYEGEDYVKKRKKMAELQRTAKREREAENTESLKSKKTKITVQNGAEVFNETGLSGMKDVEVYREREVVYAVTLGLVDIAMGLNSYYKLQILKRGQYKYELFRAWGRIGTSQGGTKFESFRSPNTAKEEFCRLYEEKTGNIWGDTFIKKAGAFYRLDLDYGPLDEAEESTIEPGSLTKLDKNVQALIKLIFDINAMKETLIEFEIDLNKMPLGKLSQKQIKEAFKVLAGVQEYLDDVSENHAHILDGTTRFFTLIPHDYGSSSPPLLDNNDIINSKTKMLETLLEMEIAYNMTREVKKENIDPIDVHYSKLKSDISVLDRTSEEFALLERYVASTHAKTHSEYTLDIINLFKVSRHGEEEVFKPFSTFYNRKLLWHGSRISNFAGILSQGLRIAPPEAPVTGYMFGKGVYFADMVSKSANYCCTTRSNNIGLLLLCEVALGDMYELKDAKYITKLPQGKHSTKGMGATTPGSIVTLDNGCEVPMGPGVEDSTSRTSLLYNEYIVYDTSQINIKYLFQLKFNYKTSSRRRR